MITEKLIDQIKYDEGVVLEVYKDHLGYDTCGVGHLLVKGNPEYGCAVGTAISERTCDAYLPAPPVSLPTRRALNTSTARPLHPTSAATAALRRSACESSS